MPVATDTGTRWKLFHTIEAQIFGMLQKDGPLAFADIDQCLENFRIAGSTLVFNDIIAASNEKVEVRLWEAVILINTRYRKILSKFDTDAHKKNHVEKRKILKRYVDFLKTSQYFYKGFVQSLASRFDVSELRKIARCMELSTLSAERHERNAIAEANATLSCHSTLLRLGDLSRYRNAVRTKNKSWDTALNYYALANELCPDNGLAYNQMAVIAVSDKDHMNALYYLYRALAINEPSPMAHNNLLIQMRKIQDEWSGNKQVTARTPPTGTEGLETWFVRLHTKMYKGHMFDGYNELEHEVLGQLQIILRQKNVSEMLNKFVMVNVGAEYFAGVRVREAPTDEHFQSYRFYLRMNVRLFTMLLQMYQPELHRPDESAPDVTGRASEGIETFTSIGRRLLPAIRLSSTWVLGRAAILVEQSKNSQLSIYIREMWAMYASTLSMIVSSYQADDLQEVEYLLEEDEETVGFKPFRDIEDCRNYVGYDGQLKPTSAQPAHPQDQGPQRSHPNAEMMSRVRDILRIGLLLSTNEMYPIHVVDGPAFVFVDPSVAEHQPVSESDNIAKINDEETVSWEVTPYNHDQHVETPKVDKVSGADNHAAFEHVSPHMRVRERAASPALSESMSMSGEMHRMVDDLTTPPAVKDFHSSDGHHDSKEASYGMNKSISSESFARHERGQSTSSLQGSSGLFFGNSPFAPLPGEMPSIGHERKSSRFNRSGRQSTSPSASQANGHADSNTGSQWLNKTGPPAHSDTPTCMQSNSNDVELNRQKYAYKPSQNVQSSTFTDNSSIYQGSPAQLNAMNWGNIGNAFGQPQGRSLYYNCGDQYPVSSMMQSSLWDGSQPARNRHMTTPPGGQGG